MRILKMTTASGPNVFHSKPVLIMTLDLEGLSDTDSTQLPGLIDRMLGHLPGLKQHRCSPGYVGGFVERLHRGTYLAHIIEHVALELSSLAGIEVGYGKTVNAGAPSIYKVAVRYRSEEGMKYLLRIAVEWVEAMIEGREFQSTPRIEEAKEIVMRTKLGPSTQAIVSAAEARNIPWRRLNEFNLIQFGYGKARRWIQATTSSLTSDISVDIAQDKELTKTMLRQTGIRVPRGGIVAGADQAVALFNSLREEKVEAIVVKPLDGNHGRGVSLNLRDEDSVRKAFEEANSISKQVMVEEQFFGNDYRVVVVDGRLIAAAKRIPAHVVGNGYQSVLELIQTENQNPLRGQNHDLPLTKLSTEGKDETFLKRIPKAGEVVILSETANLSTGGTAIDVTDEVHFTLRKLCERAARMIGLDICGIDLIADDIHLPIDRQQAGIIEVNAGPGIRMHHFPSQGKPRDVGGAIIDFLYPQPEQARIPIVAVTGTNGKTTVTRLIEHLFYQNGYRTGITHSEGVYVNRERIAEGDTTGPESAHQVLSDPLVEIAILETARGGIAKRGLGFDQCDVGIITNISADHIGQDGIESLSDILKIKSVVIDAVKPGGTIILNADDRMLREYSEEPSLKRGDRKFAFFSTEPKSDWLTKKMIQGHSCYYVNGDYIWESKNSIVTQVMRVQEIPLAMAGSSRFHLANIVASLAAVRALDMGLQEFANGVRSFHPGENQGRTNIYRLGRGYLMVDYAHNPEALKAIAEMVSTWNISRVTAVIAAPGDRADALIRSLGEVAAEHFDRIFIREDEDLRGRKRGEVAQLLYETVSETHPDVDVAIELSSTAAFDRAVAEMQDNELIIFFYDEIHSVQESLKQHASVLMGDLSVLIGRRFPQNFRGLGPSPSFPRPEVF